MGLLSFVEFHMTNSVALWKVKILMTIMPDKSKIFLFNGSSSISKYIIINIILVVYGFTISPEHFTV